MALVIRTLDALEEYWNPELGYYVSPVRTSSLTNVMYVQAVSILAGGENASKRQIARARNLLAALVTYPVLDGGIAGVSLDMGFAGTSHMSVSGPYCTALAYAYLNAEALGLSEYLCERVSEAITSQVLWLRTQLAEKTGGSNQLALRWLPEAAAAYATIGYEEEARSITGECIDPVGASRMKDHRSEHLKRHCDDMSSCGRHLAYLNGITDTCRDDLAFHFVNLKNIDDLFDKIDTADETVIGYRFPEIFL